MAMALLIKKSFWGISALAWLVAWEPSLPAQTAASLSAPLVGLIGSGREIRPITGVVGASSIGDPIGLPLGISRVYLAPRQQWALVERGQAGTMGRMSWAGMVPGAVTAISGAMAMAELVSFSPNGKNAILVSRAEGMLQVLTQLDTTPQVALQSDISQLEVAAAAISDDGTLAVVLTNAGALYRLAPNNSPEWLFQASSSAGIGFLPNQQVLAIADGAGSTITLLDGLASQPFLRMKLPGPALSGSAIFVQGSSDGNSVIVSAAGAENVYRAELRTQILSAIGLPTTVSRFDRLQGDLFLLSANSGEAAWLLLADGDNLRAGFAQFVRQPTGREPGGRNPVPRNPEPRYVRSTP